MPMSAGKGQTWQTTNHNLRIGQRILWVLPLGLAARPSTSPGSPPDCQPPLATFQIGGSTSEAATGLVQRCRVAARIISEPLSDNLALMCLR